MDASYKLVFYCSFYAHVLYEVCTNFACPDNYMPKNKKLIAADHFDNEETEVFDQLDIGKLSKTVLSFFPKAEFGVICPTPRNGSIARIYRQRFSKRCAAVRV